MENLLSYAIPAVVSLVLLWILLAVALLLLRPKRGLLPEAVRILPDTIRLLRRISADAEVPRSVRVRLWLLLVYLAIPVDLVPDFVPVLGYADDAIIVAAVLRSVVRRAGPAVIRRSWPGTADGLATVWRLARLDGISAVSPR